MAVNTPLLYSPGKPVSYREIKDYVREQHGIKLSNLDIVQVKEKHGLLVRGEHKEDKAKCPPKRESAILDAFRHFRLLEEKSPP